MPDSSPKRALARFIARFDPKIAALTRAVLAKMRARLPGANELVYDNYNALVVGFCSTDRASSAICSVAVYPRWVNLYFFNGPDLPDPQNLLKGSGSVVRRIQVDRAALIDQPVVKALIAHAVRLADTPLNRRNRTRMIIKAVAKKYRPRRPAERP